MSGFQHKLEKGGTRFIGLSWIIIIVVSVKKLRNTNSAEIFDILNAKATFSKIRKFLFLIYEMLFLPICSDLELLDNLKFCWRNWMQTLCVQVCSLSIDSNEIETEEEDKENIDIDMPESSANNPTNFYTLDSGERISSAFANLSFSEDAKHDKRATESMALFRKVDV